ncbi:MAG: fumarylacetoacetate hydrolase family protein, partial [Gammaproteobacteria bacterium]|nr:fumarylacetoacetate hydrolase family protein [Gammaproteobacteria bacterium]
MKLASVRVGGRDTVAAQVDGERVIALDALLALQGSKVTPPRSMRQLIEDTSLAAAVTEALKSADAAALESAASEPDAWYPPVRRPGKVLAVAMNNSASNARKISAPDHPAFFLKPPSCLIGHGAEIRIRPYYGSVHPEPELALVIGRDSRDLDPETALDAVFG